MRFLGQVFKKYLRGTQGRPDLCFTGFGTYGGLHRSLFSIQRSGAIKETGPTFITFVFMHFYCICVCCWACHSKRVLDLVL